MSLDKEVAEWMEGLGFTEEIVDGTKRFDRYQMSVDMHQATFFYTATKQAELKAKVWALKPYAREFNAGKASGYEFYWGVKLVKEYEKLEAQFNQTKLEKGYKDGK